MKIVADMWYNCREDKAVLSGGQLTNRTVCVNGYDTKHTITTDKTTAPGFPKGRGNDNSVWCPQNLRVRVSNVNPRK